MVNILEALRLEAPEARFYQASSWEMFGLIQDAVQSEVFGAHDRSA